MHDQPITHEDGARRGLDVEIDEAAGSLRVVDPRAFHAGRRAFCRRLAEAVARSEGVGKVEIDLGSASCRVEFGPGSSGREAMAGAFVAAVRDASDAGRGLGAWLGPRESWSALTAFPVGDGDGVSVWESAESSSGARVFRHRGGGDGSKDLQAVAVELNEEAGVVSCRVARWPSRLKVDAAGRSPAELAALAERALARAPSEPGAAPATGMRRAYYLALAGGSFVLTAVGAIIPGFPTVPFLLATSYYLARSSPRLDARLRRAPLLGRVLREWEEHGKISRASKGRLVILTVVCVAIAVAVAPLSPAALGLIAVMVSISLVGISQMPELPSPEASPGLPSPALA